MKPVAKSIDDIRADGFKRGEQLASWTDIPDDINPGVLCDFVEAVEAKNRTYQEFENTRYTLNSHPDNRAAWEAFNAGVRQGVVKGVARRLSVNAAANVRG